MKRYDTIVVGAGPAGSTAARLLAQRGANVLLLDRAAFPRDKPCGGAVTIRAAHTAGLDLEPVIERTIHDVLVTFRLGSPFVRTSPEPLTYMTQRCRLDAYLADCAAEAGADFRDGTQVREIEVGEREVVVHANGDAYRAPTIVGADGANGVTARALGLAPAPERAVALEGNVPADGALAERWQRTIALDLGGIPGGYGWVFPKDGHLNVGVGGWRHVGPSLRERLDELCGYLGFDESKLFGLRGHNLPLRQFGAPIARGPGLLAGDAAGLVDPLSGEGIDAAFASGRLAADSIERELAGEEGGLSSYEPAIERELMPDIATSRQFQAIFHRLPRPCVTVMRRSDRFWRSLCGFVRGDSSYASFRQALGPFRRALDLTARLATPGDGRDPY